MNPTDIEEMNVADANDTDFIQVNNSRTHISKKLSLKALLHGKTKSWTEHCGFKLENVDYDERSVTLVKNDKSEEVKFSFEFIQDMARFTRGKGEWDWRKLHPKK